MTVPPLAAAGSALSLVLRDLRPLLHPAERPRA
jgi:hypothetical protein